MDAHIDVLWVACFLTELLCEFFAAEGETSVVKAWHLRPTLIWKDGEWIESRSKDKGPSTQVLFLRVFIENLMILMLPSYGSFI